jgi:hypothetical protein
MWPYRPSVLNFPMKTTSRGTRHFTFETIFRTLRVVRDSQCSSKSTHTIGSGVGQDAEAITDFSKSVSYMPCTRITRFLNFSECSTRSQYVTACAPATICFVTAPLPVLWGCILPAPRKPSVKTASRQRNGCIARNHNIGKKSACYVLASRALGHIPAQYSTWTSTAFPRTPDHRVAFFELSRLRDNF